MLTYDDNIVVYTSSLMVRFLPISTEASWISSGGIYTVSDIIFK